MRQEDNSIITLCPSIGQFFINELPLLLLCVAMLLIGVSATISGASNSSVSTECFSGA